MDILETIHTAPQDIEPPWDNARRREMSTEPRSTVTGSFAKPVPASPMVFVIGGDASLYRSLDTLARDASWKIETVASTNALLGKQPSFTPNCLVLDISEQASTGILPGPWPIHMPVIGIADACDILLSVRAMKEIGRAHV